MEIAAITILAVVVVWLLLRSWVRGRAQVRRVTAISERLDSADELERPDETRKLETALARLERSADAAAAQTDAEVADRRRFVEACDRLDVGVVIADESGSIAYSNPVAKRYLGAQRVFAVVDRQVRDSLHDVISTASACESSLDLIGPPRRLLSLRVWPLDDGARTIGASALITDSTQARRVDEVRRDFVSNISHELKTPVAALALLAETLSDTLDDPEVTQRFARRLIDESQRLVGIIDDLIELSRIEAQKAPIREAISLDAVVSGAVERVKLDLADRQPNVAVDIDASLSVVGDRRQLATALYNLIQNAVKYSAIGNPVEVSARVDDGEVTVDVKDSGIGIPRRDIDRIFERFYRVDRARSRASGGTGLGLAIVRHVANNHDGRVQASSDEGLGSTLSFTLPLPHDEIAEPGADRLPNSTAESAVELLELEPAPETIDAQAAK